MNHVKQILLNMAKARNMMQVQAAIQRDVNARLAAAQVYCEEVAAADSELAEIMQRIAAARATAAEILAERAGEVPEDFEHEAVKKGLLSQGLAEEQE